MLALLGFIFNVKWWSDLVSAAIQSIPSVIKLLSELLLGLYTLATWYFVKMYDSLKIWWLNPKITVLILSLMGGASGTTYYYAKDIVVAELRQDYRFVPKDKKPSRAREVKTWIGNWF